jgi:hypothetical protein
MAIIGGFDVHRAQITFDYLHTATGEVTHGQIRPATRSVLRDWLGRFTGRDAVAFAVEGCTGWRFVVEELVTAGSRRTWPSPLTPRPNAAARNARRPTAPTPACNGSCCLRDVCGVVDRAAARA